MTRIRVAHIVHNLKPRGTQRFVANLVQALPNEEFDQTVFCLFSRGILAEEVERVGVPIHVLNIPWGKMSISGYRCVADALRGNKFDIVHCHHIPSSWYGIPVAWILGVPVRIAHLHNIERNLSFRARIFDRAIFQFASAAFACSKAVFAFYEKHLRYPASKCHIVYNGIFARPFLNNLMPKGTARMALGFSEEHILVATVARLEIQKGHVYLIEAAAEVVQRFPKVHFLFVGEGSLRSELEYRAANLGILAHVHFLGERMDVPQILAASDIFVLPSLWEGLGIALIEAGLAGLPVVASRVDGIVEVVEDKVNGFLVPPRNVAEMARALRTLIEDASLREKMGREGRSIALERFNMEQIAFQVATLYRRLLDQAKG